MFSVLLMDNKVKGSRGPWGELHFYGGKGEMQAIKWFTDVT